MLQRIQALAAEHHAEIVRIRRHLHTHPELSFQEVETARFVASTLESWGISFQAGIVDTGIVATISGRNPESKLVALRADLDALPINEANEVPYRSVNPGVMHACGHDVHTASLLGAMKILHTLRDAWGGTVRCIFQPGEEQLPGGASMMIKAGVLESPRPQLMFGQHVYPELEAGKVGFRGGMYMASTDEIYVTITGRGGHAALPHKVIDPVLITAHLITALQQLVSRKAKPGVPTVLSFGKVEANGATNIIPNEVHLQGTFRTMNEAWRDEAHSIMRSLAEQLAASMGGRCDFQIKRGYPFLVNDDQTTAAAKQAAQDYLGKENVVDLEHRMTAEDFAYFSQELPACFYRLGVSNAAKGISSGLHTPTFDVDEKALETGMGLMAWITACALQKN